jgi:hypothetical protein
LVNFEITWRKDVFRGAPQAGSAENFGTLGINFRARKAKSEVELAIALEALSCEMPINAQPSGACLLNLDPRG